MSGVLRLANTGGSNGRSTIVAAASTDATFTLPPLGGTLLTSNFSAPGETITLDGANVIISNGDLNVNSGTLFVDESTNRVGIGTTTPLFRFDVTGGGIAVRDTTADINETSITFGETGSGNAYSVRLGQTANATLGFEKYDLGWAETARINSDGQLLVGTTDAVNNSRLGAKLVTANAGGANSHAGLCMTNYNSNPQVAPFVDFNKSLDDTEGTFTTPLTNLTTIGYVVWRGSDGTGFKVAADIQCLADGDASANSTPGLLSFGTSPDGSTTTIRRLIINSLGRVAIGNFTPAAPLHISDADHGVALGYIQGATLPESAGIYTSSSTDFGQAYGSLIIQSRTDFSGYSTIFRGEGGESMRITSGKNLQLQRKIQSAYTNGGNGDSRTLTLPSVGDEGACFLLTTQRSPSLDLCVSNTSIIYYNGKAEFMERQNVAGTWPVGGLTVTFNDGGTY